MLFLSRFKVSGHSMEPEFVEGEKVVVSFLPYLLSRPKVGDLVALKHPQKKKILLKKIEKVYNNNTFYAVGLNKNDSFDSAKFGTVSKDQILGKVIFNY